MNRRQFLKDSTALSMTMALAAGVEELFPESASATEDPPTGAPVTCAVIGLGPQGREMLGSLAKMNAAPILAICDTYTDPSWLKRSQDIAPKADLLADYRKVLDRKDIQAVFIATPSHQHQQIALDALAAGKHVYCEAPLATSLEEAKAIAKAGLNAKTIFQPGIQERYNEQHLHVLKFVRGTALGLGIPAVIGGRAQWHNKQSWHIPAPTEERRTQLNWRLHSATSSGLAGEIGIHQFDTATWYIGELPLSVTGFGATMFWTNDGMQVPDTIQCILEYPNNVRYMYDATLASSFDGAYELFLGSESSIMLRDQRAWMFKETDAQLLGWEVFARKDTLSIGVVADGSGVATGVGVALVANATKLLAQGKQPGDVGTDVSKTSLYQAIDSFLGSVRTGTKPKAGAQEGYQATVIAHKTHEAIMTGNKITFQKEWFDLS